MLWWPCRPIVRTARLKQTKEREREFQLAEAKKMLGVTKNKLQKELQERKRLGP